MKYFAAALALMPLAACATNAPPPEPIVERGGKPYQFTADPGALVAVDMAMHRAMRQDGFAKAAKDYAAKDAQILYDRRYAIADFPAAGAPKPPVFTRSTPVRAMLSCDGRMGAAVTVSVDANDAVWQTLTIWAQTPKGWRWIMQKSAFVQSPLVVPDVVSTKIAKCGTKAGVSLSAPAVGVDRQVGLSPDQSLSFTSTDYKNGATELTVALWDGQTMVPEIAMSGTTLRRDQK